MWPGVVLSSPVMDAGAHIAIHAFYVTEFAVKSYNDDQLFHLRYKIFREKRRFTYSNRIKLNAITLQCMISKLAQFVEYS